MENERITMEVRIFIYALILFGLVMTGLTYFMSDLGSQFGQTPEDMSGLVPLNQIYSNATDMSTTFNTKITGIPILDISIVSVKGFIDLISNVAYNLFTWWAIIPGEVGHYLHLPGWVVSGILALMMFAILFEVISSIIRWRT
jgi:hypothetical protein